MQTRLKRNARIWMFTGMLALTAFLAGCVLLPGQLEQAPMALPMQTHPDSVARLLAGMDIWVIPQPKEVTQIPLSDFELAGCAKFCFVGEDNLSNRAIAQATVSEITQGTTWTIPLKIGSPEVQAISVGVFPDGRPPADLHGIRPADLAGLGEEGYVIAIDEVAVSIAARSYAGLMYGARTLGRIAEGRQVLPGLRLRDWPALRYRGAQQDISRGQVPTTATLHQLADVLAQGKMNLLELYIENAFDFPSHPDIAPPEALTHDEARTLSDYARGLSIEVHPLFQGLGHSNLILSKPEYQHLRVGPSEKQPWIMTYDVRKPETLALIEDLVNDLCIAMPGRLFNVDITEIDIDGLKAQGLTDADATEMVFQYVLKLREMLQARGRRLMIAQGPLDSTGHLAGLGPKLGQLPKDIIIGSYYCAGGPYSPAWEKDFPRLRREGLDFFAQAWINSHIRLMPWVGNAREFSDAEVSKGLSHGALGSITCDWGDAGNFHLTGQTWYPFLYHAASAWTGARVNRDYFDHAFTRILYGVADAGIAQAIHLAGNINGLPTRVLDAEGNVISRPSYHFWEFFGDPFSHPDLVSLADPAASGYEILRAADKASRLLERAIPRARRNHANLEQLLFGARCYAAMGRKMIALGNYRDSSKPRADVAQEFEAVAREYESLKSTYERLWLAENRDNANFRQTLLPRFDQTIDSCRAQAQSMQK